MDIMRLSGLFFIIPATMLLVVSYFVLLTAGTASKGLQSFGRVLAVLLWICALLVASAGIITALTRTRPFTWGAEWGRGGWGMGCGRTGWDRTAAMQAPCSPCPLSGMSAYEEFEDPHHPWRQSDPHHGMFMRDPHRGNMRYHRYDEEGNIILEESPGQPAQASVPAETDAPAGSTGQQ